MRYCTVQFSRNPSKESKSRRASYRAHLPESRRDFPLFLPLPAGFIKTIASEAAIVPAGRRAPKGSSTGGPGASTRTLQLAPSANGSRPAGPSELPVGLANAPYLMKAHDRLAALGSHASGSKLVARKGGSKNVAALGNRSRGTHHHSRHECGMSTAHCAASLFCQRR